MLEAILESVLADGVNDRADHGCGRGRDPGKEGLQPTRQHLAVSVSHQVVSHTALVLSKDH